MQTQKKFLFIISKPPHSSASARESTDAMMATCAFGQQASILALGNGVYQFTKDQDTSGLNMKDTAAMLESLPLYGTEAITVLTEDLTRLGLNDSDFIIPLQCIAKSDLPALINNADIVLNY